MLTQQAIQEFLLSRGGLRPKTIRDYQKQLEHFNSCFPILPDKPQPIQSWLNSFRSVVPETVHSYFRALRALYNQICRWHPETVNPMPLVRPPRLLPKAMRIFADEELHRIFCLPLSPRDRALLTLLLDIGPRAAECANLTWEDVIPGYVMLNGKTGQRVVPVSEITYRLLTSLQQDDGTDRQRHVFLGKRGALKYQGIYKLVRHLCNLAGIDGKRCSPHTFRHTFGTNYAAAEGCDPKVLQDILGHQDFKTTLRYIQNNPRRMAQNHQRCTPLKVLAIAAQASLFNESEAVRQAEEIVAAKWQKKLGGSSIPVRQSEKQRR